MYLQPFSAGRFDKRYEVKIIQYLFQQPRGFHCKQKLLSSGRIKIKDDLKWIFIMNRLKWDMVFDCSVIGKPDERIQIIADKKHFIITFNAFDKIRCIVRQMLLKK